MHHRDKLNLISYAEISLTNFFFLIWPCCICTICRFSFSFSSLFRASVLPRKDFIWFPLEATLWKSRAWDNDGLKWVRGSLSCVHRGEGSCDADEQAELSWRGPGVIWEGPLGSLLEATGSTFPALTSTVCGTPRMKARQNVTARSLRLWFL